MLIEVNNEQMRQSPNDPYLKNHARDYKKEQLECSKQIIII